ncbi:hypothetical protein A2U01_0067537, partial [Trifolium medium]|nr:hypothetical protein [Trifolium medium]
EGESKGEVESEQEAEEETLAEIAAVSPFQNRHRAPLPSPEPSPSSDYHHASTATTQRLSLAGPLRLSLGSVPLSFSRVLHTYCVCILSFSVSFINCYY